MEQKDFILREIEKIKTLLLSIIGEIVPSKSIIEQQRTEELISNQIKVLYGKNLNYILNLEKGYFDAEFSHNKGFNFENIELLGDLLFTLGNDDFNLKIAHLKKAVELYRFIDNMSKTFSFERQEKIRIIESLMLKK
jgi:hypothetical protein